MKFIAAFTFFLTLASLAQALDLAGRTFTATNGTRITAEYNIGHQAGYRGGAVHAVFARGMSMAVSYSAAKATDRVRLVVIDHTSDTNTCSGGVNTQNSQYQEDLRWRNGAFVANLSSEVFLIQKTAPCSLSQGYLEFAVVVNGQWLTDTIGNKSNFELHF